MNQTRATAPQANTLGSRVWRQFGSRGIWKPSFTLYALFFYTLTAVAFDAFRLNSFETRWIPIWVGTYIGAVALAWLLAMALPKILWRTPRTGRITNFALAMLVGAAKNSAVFWWAKLIGLESSDWDTVTRVVGGATLGLGILMSWIALNGSRIGHRDLMQSLLEKQRELLSYRAQVTSQANEAQSALVKQTQAALIPKLNELDALLAGASDTQRIVANLQELVEREIRPLSRAFQDEAERLASSSDPKTINQRDRRVLPAKFTIRENLTPFAAMLVFLPSHLITVYMLVGSQALIQILPSELPTIALLFAWRQLWPRNRELKRSTGLLALNGLTFLCTIPQGVMMWQALAGFESLRVLMIGSFASYTMLSMTILSYLRILDRSRLDLEQQLILVNEELTHELAVFNQVLWLQKRRWGYLLHGTVQATLTAAIARLKSLDASGTSTFALDNPQTSRGMLTELVRQDLRKVTEVITNPPKPEVNLAAELQALQDTWRGVLDISVNVSERARRVLDRSDNARMALNEICREAATNAFRHGGATTMTIKIDRPNDGELHLVATNNGRPVAASIKGMGQQMMDALTIDWTLESKKTAGLTVLSARLPVALN